MPAPYRLAGFYQQSWTDLYGNGVIGGSVAIYTVDTTTRSKVYTDATKLTEAANPVTATGVGSKLDELGNLSLFLDPGWYDTVTTTANGKVGPTYRIKVEMNTEEAAQLGSDGLVLPTQGGGGSGSIVDGSVTTAKLADGAVTDAKVATGIAQAKVTALTTDLAARALTTDARFTDQRVPTDGSVTNAKVAAGAAIDQAKIAGLGTSLAAKADLVAGVVPTAQIPAVAISDYLGDVASQAAMLALAGQRGDWCTRSDVSASFILTADDPTLLANWKQLPTPPDAVLSVDGATGVVVLPGDGAANVATKRTLGTGATQAAPGNLGATGTADTTTFLRGDRAWVVPPGGSLTVQEEGTALATAATTLNFVGGGVTAAGTTATKTITVLPVQADGTGLAVGTVFVDSDDVVSTGESVFDGGGASVDYAKGWRLSGGNATTAAASYIETIHAGDA